MVRDLPQSAGGILSYFTRHKTLANLLLVVLLMAGAVALPKMRAQFFPDVVVDSINISVAWNGAGAEDVDQGIVKVLEPALLAVEGVSGASSRSTEGRARISLEFDPDWDMSRANADVETALDGISTLPDDAEDPVILRGSWSDRVTEVVISGPIGVTQLGLIADEFALRLFNAGVTKTSIQGIAAPQVVIEVPTAKLVAEDITMRQIANAIAQEVSADPAGDVSGSNMRVRTGVEKRSAEDIAEIVLRSNGDGSKLKIGDVALLRDEGIDRLRSFYVGDNQAITLRVDRSAAGDAISIQEAVEEEAAKLEGTLPQGTTIELIPHACRCNFGASEPFVEKWCDWFVVGGCAVIFVPERQNSILGRRRYSHGHVRCDRPDVCGGHYL
jgi:multidrug efflux pump subunit AcrB